MDIVTYILTLASGAMIGATWPIFYYTRRNKRSL